MFEDARRAGLPFAVPEFHTESHDAYRQLDEIQIETSFYIQEGIIFYDGKTISDIFNKNNYTDQSVLKAVVEVRQYDKRLGFSQKWTTDFVYQVVMLAKRRKASKRRIRQGFCTKNLYDKTKTLNL